MRINHNISALNTYSRLVGANDAQGKSLEKLSSGLRINKAGDDAAGLAISEKMRGQIRGLNQAQRNAQDGISMIQTAEGALNETHSILQRMRELAVQSSNDTNTTSDRAEIQKEINQLTSEINRIGNATEFNTQKLLNGTLSSSGSTASGASVTATTTAKDYTNAQYSITILCDSADTETFIFDGVTLTAEDANHCLSSGEFYLCSSVAGTAASIAGAINDDATLKDRWIATNNGDGTITLTARAACGARGTGGNAKALTGTLGLKSCITQTICGTNATCQVNTITLSACNIVEGTKVKIGDVTVALWDSTKGTYQDENAAKAGLDADYVFNVAHSNSNSLCEVLTCLSGLCDEIAGVAFNYTNGCASIEVQACVEGTAGAAAVATSVTAAAGSAASGGGVTFQIGANAGQDFTATFEDMRAAALEISCGTASETHVTSDNQTAYFTATACASNGTATEYALDVSDSDKAVAAISAIDDAMKSVSAERSKLGSYTNRLEHTINNLGTSSENLTAAESRIRDVDMAKEMMEFTKNNILNQAATAMLAQANQQPQGVLQLLR